MTFLNRSVLVLNRNWIPIGSINVKKAISLLFSTNPNGAPKGASLDLTDMSMHTVSSQWALSIRHRTTFDEQDTTEYIYSAKMRIRVPKAIILPDYTGISAPRKIPADHLFDKKTMFCRDRYTCAYCRKRSRRGRGLTVDHVVPICRGGQSRFSNCVTACTTCNTRKGNKTPEEAGMKLSIKPKRPTLKQLTSLHRERFSELWEDLLQSASTEQEIGEGSRCAESASVK